VEPGDAVVVGSRLLLLSRVGATRLVIEPDERNLALLKVGQRATASAEAFADERFAAELQYIAPSVDPQRGTVEVRLAVPKPPAYLRPHMTVSVEIEVGRQDQASLLPRSAVRDLAGKEPFVLAVVDGRAQRQLVKVGIRGDDQVEVVGLDDDAWVIADETSDLTPGDRVRPLRED
jgi:HlyD family secretion protein